MKIVWSLLLGALVPFAMSAVEIEAESGTVSNAAGIKANEKASGGKTVVFKSVKRSMKKPAADEAPALVLKATIEKAGKYKVIAVVYTPNTSSDSVFFAMDNDEPKDKHFGFPKTGAPIVLSTCSLTAGEHLIKFWPREPNLEIDKVILEETK